ncbi:MAG: HAMP domain-containing sensor histidine kinase, partial [Actinomycetota bacterium]
MTLRRRAAIRTTVVMVLAVVLVLVVARQVASNALLAAIDDDLRTLAEVAPAAVGPAAMEGTGPDTSDPNGPGGPGGPDEDSPRRRRSLNELRRLVPPGSRRITALLGIDGPLQVLAADGTPTAATEPALPVTSTANEVARGGAGAAFETVTVQGAPVRLLTVPLPGGGAVQLGRSLAEVEATLTQLTTRLLVIGGLLAVGAAAASLLVADRLVRPVGALTATAEHVARTQQLDTRIAPEGDDELARLGRAFDRMLVRLEEARAAQTQLIADASHELRTPLTSLRTNIDLLRSGARLGTEDQAELLADLDEQLTEFGHLVDGLVELARGEQAPAELAPIHLDVLVDEVVAAARRDHPAARFTVQATPIVVAGDERRLGRAVRAVVDNAVVHGGGDVEVAVTRTPLQARITVRDHGPGIDPQDRARVLGRFYRSAAARSRPGSGLGLAITEQAVRTHGGSIELQDTPGGGATVVLRLPAGPDRPARVGGRDGWVGGRDG